MTTVGLIVLLLILILIWAFFPDARGAPWWKFVYFIVAVCVIIWILDVSGLWHPGQYITSHRHSENRITQLSPAVTTPT
jgi:hypothetical protein